MASLTSLLLSPSSASSGRAPCPSSLLLSRAPPTSAPCLSAVSFSSAPLLSRAPSTSSPFLSGVSFSPSPLLSRAPSTSFSPVHPNKQFLCLTKAKTGDGNSDLSDDSESYMGETDAELGEKLLSRLTIRFMVDALENADDNTREKIFKEWSEKLDHILEAGVFEKDRDYIDAYYGRDTALIFFHMDSTNPIMRRRMAVLSMAVGGLKLRELECFPLDKFLQLLKVEDLNEIQSYKRLLFKMEYLAKRINWL